MKEYKCTNCGATINHVTGVCPYCRSRYKIEDDNVLRIETYTSPVRVYRKKMIVPDRILHRENSPEFSEHLLKELAKSFTEAVVENMEVYVSADPRRMEQTVSAQIRIVDPNYRFDEGNYE